MTDAEILIHDRYELKLKECLGAGSFGTVYTCYDRILKRKLAMKLEPLHARIPQLEYEYKLYRHLTNVNGIPKAYAYISNYNFSFGHYNILILDYIGKSLEGNFERCRYKFPLHLVLQLGYKLIGLVSSLHAHSLLHRDIKPDNFLVDASGNLYMIDFGLSKRYRDPKTDIHISYREGKRLTGTPRYASISSQLGIEMGRRDDLESVAYMLVYFLNGRLPWQGLKASSSRTKQRLILEKKMSTPIELLYKGVPYEFRVFAEYVHNLRFADKPDYEYLQSLFVDCAKRHAFPIHVPIQWPKLYLAPLKEEGAENEKEIQQIE
jgi:serine/threonine protein kinase